MRRIKEHIAERWHTGDFGKSELIHSDLLSTQLRAEIIAALNKDVLMKIAFFRSATFEAIQQICVAAEDRKFLPGELIFRRGEISSGLYLIRSGTVVLSPLSTSWTNMHRTVEESTSDMNSFKESKDDGTRPIKSSFMRLQKRARFFKKAMARRSINFRPSTSELPKIHEFPVTTGSWFGEAEVLREAVLGGDVGQFRRTSTAEARTVVKVIFIPKEALTTVLLENPQILQEILIAHQKRFNSADLPADLRNAFRFDDEWEEKVFEVITEISRAREAAESAPHRRASYAGPSRRDSVMINLRA